MIRRKLGPILFSLILSGLMSLVVSGLSTFRVMGLVPGFARMWTDTWLTAWLLAFPTVLFMAPITRHVVEYLIEQR